MATLEELRPGVHIKGLLPGKLVTVIEVKPYGTTVVEVTYKEASGLPGMMLLYQQDAARLEIASLELPWSFDADGTLFRLVSEAYRISLAYLFDPLIAVHTSLIEPLSRNERARYQRYDWGAKRLAEWHEIQPAKYLLLEGVSSSREAFRPYIALSI